MNTENLESNVKKLKNVDTALDLRDAFAKILYNEIFKWILSRISLFFQSNICSLSNQQKINGNSCNAGGTITMFDMFGFEVFFIF